MKPNSEVSSSPQVQAGERSEGLAKDTEGSLPLRALLTQPVVVSIANYGMIALLEMTTGTLLPLVWSTSVEFGGLSMSPASIGLWMGGYGFANCIFQLIAFPPIVKRFGPWRVFLASVVFVFPVYILFPLENLVSRHSSRAVNPTAVLFIVLQLSAMSVSAMGFGKFVHYLTLCLVTEVVHVVTRLNIYVYFLCGPQQTVTRRYEWYRADGGLDAAHGRTGRCSVAVCILTGQQHIGGKLCVCRTARHRVCWAGRSFSTSEEHMEA